MGRQQSGRSGAHGDQRGVTSLTPSDQTGFPEAVRSTQYSGIHTERRRGIHQRDVGHVWPTTIYGESHESVLQYGHHGWRTVRAGLGQSEVHSGKMSNDVKPLEIYDALCRWIRDSRSKKKAGGVRSNGPEGGKSLARTWSARISRMCRR